jgi:hypothetical protein
MSEREPSDETGGDGDDDQRADAVAPAADVGVT